MNDIWWIILVTGIDTYLMRSTGMWIRQDHLQAPWLNHVPFAVILVMAFSSIINLNQTRQELIAVSTASLVVVAVSMKKLPLILCIAIGCIAFGILAN